ncbi:hypothetical protein D9M71_791420 [compost metagenome]
MHRDFEVAALRILGIARQPASRLQGRIATSQNGHAVPRRLPMPQGAVTDIAQLLLGKLPVRRLQFLQAHHIRCLALEPVQQRAQARAQSVDIEGGDFQPAHVQPSAVLSGRTGLVPASSIRRRG